MRAHFQWSYNMTENTTSDFTPEVLSNNEPTWYQTKGKVRKPGSPKFPPDEDIDLWLKHNAPLTFQQLADIRYALYHRCTRSDFSVSKVIGDQFDLIGRHNKLRIRNDAARHYLLWRLRLLGRQRKWNNALPRTRNPRK
jgi:hypothetical protein